MLVLAVGESLVMVVHGHGEGLLGLVLTNDETVQVILYLVRAEERGGSMCIGCLSHNQMFVLPPLNRNGFSGYNCLYS